MNTEEVSTSIWELISALQEAAAEVCSSISDEDELTEIVLFKLLDQCA